MAGGLPGGMTQAVVRACFLSGLATVAGIHRLMPRATEVENALAAMHYELARGEPTSVGRWVWRSRCRSPRISRARARVALDRVSVFGVNVARPGRLWARVLALRCSPLKLA